MDNNADLTPTEFGKYKNILLDRDGTLFATCLANYAAYIQSLSHFDLKVNPSMSEGFHSGLNWTTIAKLYYPSFNLKLINDVHKFKVKIFNKHLDKVKLNETLLNLIKEFNVVIVTNSSKEGTQMILKEFSLQNNFINVVGSETKLEPKPAPDLFIHAIKTFKMNPMDTLVIEDSLNGRLAAENAGLAVFHINHFCNLH
jgi:HAD superfamily hydrolase (TIGR01509 family)